LYAGPLIDYASILEEKQHALESFYRACLRLPWSGLKHIGRRGSTKRGWYNTFSGVFHDWVCCRGDIGQQAHDASHMKILTWQGAVFMLPARDSSRVIQDNSVTIS
jgi:hypothetical protein